MLSVDRNISLFDDSKRTLAKLMAMENLTVQIIAGVPTASFDPVSRVLTLPDWPQLTIPQIDTQIGHEVGHALFTDHSWLKATAQARKDKLHPGLHSYINVVEDARIERKMRESYPGMKATFYDGRLDFAKKGPIFQIADDKNVLFDKKKKTPVKSLPLIDRINLFYKIGAFIDIPFGQDEWKWIDLIDKAWSTERAIEIAKQLHELAKDDIMEQMEQAKQRQQMTGEGGEGEPGEPMESDDDEQSGDSDGDGDDSDDKDDKDGSSGSGDEEKKEDDKKKSSTGDGDEEGDEKDSKSKKADGKESKKPAKPSKRKLTPEEKAKRDALDPTSKTDNALEQALKELGEDAKNVDPRSQIRHLLLKPLDESVVRARTIPAKQWADDVLSAFPGANYANLESRWNAQYLSTAENMASEFLRRKTAKNLMHARIGRTGRLDMNKLARYQFADDIFKRTMTVPNGQSHGIVMMIDGSSSMSGVFSSVLDQVLLFAHFAFRANIPFEAYMFNDCKSFHVKDEAMQTIVMPDKGHLVGLVNTVTDRAMFKRNTQALLLAQNQFGSGSSRSYIPHMRLGGTPLYAGMMLMERHVARMKKTLNLDKVMTIVISDGDDNEYLYYTDANVDRSGSVVSSKTVLGTGAFVVRDMVTKKNHQFLEATSASHFGSNRTTYGAPKNAVITMLFDIMRSRHDARNIYMYLVSGASDFNRYGSPAMPALAKMVRSGAEMSADESAVRKAMTDVKQFVLPVTEGVADCAIVIEPAGLVLRENDFANWNSKGATQEQVSRKFIDDMKKAVANRTFVNSVVPFLV